LNSKAALPFGASGETTWLNLIMIGSASADLPGANTSAAANTKTSHLAAAFFIKLLPK
jgi:hypothetical protein